MKNTVKTRKIDGLNFHLKRRSKSGTTELSRAFPAERGHRVGSLAHLLYKFFLLCQVALVLLLGFVRRFFNGVLNIHPL